MGKNNNVSAMLVLAVVLMIAITTYLVVNYTTGVVTAAIAFAQTDQMTKLQACGVAVPPELFKLKNDIPSLLLPATYVGLPGLMILIAILMFVAGHYYGNENKEHSSSETTTTTSSPNRSHESGRYETGTHVDETRTQKSSKSEGN